VEGTPPYRVKAVAEMLDVSVSTIYRAIRAGELDAYKIGTGKGAVIRIPAQAILVYLDECGDAAYHAYVEGGADPAVEDREELSPAQADGLACVVCGADFLTVAVARRPVGRSGTGSQVFACSEHVDQGAACGAALAGEVAR
ncbi:MAG: helix-turn-helix domain-containing protein, partial [Micromonosporaceae bacterium]